MPSSRGYSWPMDWVQVSWLLHWQVGSLPQGPLGKPLTTTTQSQVPVIPIITIFLKYSQPLLWSVLCSSHCRWKNTSEGFYSIYTDAQSVTSGIFVATWLVNDLTLELKFGSSHPDDVFPKISASITLYWLSFEIVHEVGFKYKWLVWKVTLGKI